MKTYVTDDDDELDELDENKNNEFEDTSTSVNKLRTLLFKIKYSEKLNIKFRGFCEIVNLTYSTPVMDVKTRWNSTKCLHILYV